MAPKAQPLLPISALQHLLFCERQCALIYIEREWAENELTIEGALFHDKVHGRDSDTRDGVRVYRGLPIVSHSLRLRGVADVIERHPDGRWIPVEYKRGRPKRDDCDRIQVCAQGICLEEMVEVDVPFGVLFYGRTRRRVDVPFDRQLRTLTRDVAARLHVLFQGTRTPAAHRQRKCGRCSLRAVCMPEAMGSQRSSSYLQRMARQIEEGEP